MDYYVYILKSLCNEYYYKGITTNIDTRLNQHNKGLTLGNKKFLPFGIVFVQICNSYAEARELEKYLKSGSGREIIPEIVLPPW